MNCQRFQVKLSFTLILSLLLARFTSGQHLLLTWRGQKPSSLNTEHLFDSQTRYYGTQHYRTSNSTQNQLSPNPDKPDSPRSFSLNRRFRNLEKGETQYTHPGRSAQQQNQSLLRHFQEHVKSNGNQTLNGLLSLDRLSEPADPFFASIDGKRFYGGVITYSYDLHPARICRVMNPCIRNDATLLLPQWMQRHDNILKFQCGHPKIDFSMSDNESPPPLEKIDLVGITSSRPSMPDFVTDFMPSAVVFDLVYGGHPVSKSCHSRKGEDCYLFPTLEESFTPAVILHPRIRTLENKKNWVRQFIELMKPPSDGIDTEMLYADSMREKRPEMTCFRSVLFTRGPFNKNIIMKNHLRQIHFLETHGIVKKAREVVLSQDAPSSSNLCSLKVTITNRKLEEGASKRLTGRYITDLPTIIDAILDRAQVIPGLHLNITATTLEDKSLRRQINVMQNTDIWVAGHGPLLTNMLFLREKSSVLEIQPFTYYPKTYEKMAEHIAHVSHEPYIADPDVETFKTCISQIYGATGTANREPSELLGRYILASKKYFQNDNTHTLVLHSLTGEDTLPFRKCAQMQRLTVNARNFAVAVVRHARVRCRLPKPM